MKKRLLSILLVLAMVFTLSPAMSITASAGSGSCDYRYPEYNNENDVTSGIKQWHEDGDCINPTAVTENDTQWGTSDSETWYYVMSSVTITHGITVKGNVNLILVDGNKLTVNVSTEGDAGINVSGDSNSLTIYGQSEGTGELNVTGGDLSAGIGGNTGTSGKNITINGGVVVANGGFTGAGIGGGISGGCSKITINGGNVTATGGTQGSGIGCGQNNANATDITINGGTVKATGINGGAGIGGRNVSQIKFNGGEITATGGDDSVGIGGSGTISDIYVLDSLVVKAGSSENPTTEIAHTSAQDLTSSFSGKRYVTITPKFVIEITDCTANSSLENTKYPTIAAALKAADTNAATIKLIDDITENVTIVKGQDITLDLNGHVLKAKSTGSAITNNGTLTIKDSSTTDNTHYFKVDSDGVWVLDDTLTTADYTFDAESGLKKDGAKSTDIPAQDKVIKVTGGCITGGTGNVISSNAYGGGIYNNGTLFMEGGNVVGNHSSGCSITSSGGVHNVSQYTMTAGAVIGNSAYYGGGIYNQAGGTFNFKGGIISSNISYGGYGGGVYNYATFNMSGGTISCNTVEGDSIALGGGIFNFMHSIVMTGGTISGNKATGSGNGYGGGVYNMMGTFTMTDGTISENMAKDLGGGVMCGLVETLKLGGKAKITGNTAGSLPSNLVLDGSSTVTIGTETNGVDKPAKEMKIGVTLADENGEVISGPFTNNGTETDKDYFFSDSNSYAVKYVKAVGETAAHLELTNEICNYESTVFAGESQSLLLGDNEAGKFNISGSECKGFTLKYENGKYVYPSGTSVVRSNNSYTWKYDGGLYTEVKTKITKKILFWKKTVYKTTKYYLDVEDEELVLSTEKVNVKVQVNATSHTYTYLHDKDGKHEAVCTKCGKHEEAVEHDYTFNEENHKCICGKIDPDYCFVKDVKVTEKKTTKTTGFWFFKKTVTKYQYIIEPKTQDVMVSKVEYSGNNEDWDTGTEFLSDVKVNTFFIKITDAEGHVSYWKYEDGDISKPYSILYEDTDKWTADESNPTTIWGDQKATLKLNTKGFIIVKERLVVSNAEIDSWTQNDEYTQGTLVISNATGDVTISFQAGSCFVKGTKVTMADGSLKNIEDISVGEEVLTFNHETGKYEAQKVYYFYTSPEPVKTITLHFSEGEDLTLNMHYFFIKESLKYELITRQNAKEFVGKHFYNSDLGKYVKLEKVDYGNELTDIYAINTDYNENSIANGFLSLPDDVGFKLNIYTFDENLLADKDALAADIEKYGLIEYREGSVYSKEDYDRFQIKYYNIAVGKGLITWEKIYEARDNMYGDE